MICLEEGTEGIQILAFSVLARVYALVPCLHDKSLHGGGPGGGRAGGSRIVGLGCAGSLLGALCQCGSKGTQQAARKVVLGAEWPLPVQEDFSCAPKGRVGVTPPEKPLH